MSIKLDHKTRISKIKLAEDSKEITVFLAAMLISIEADAFYNLQSPTSFEKRWTLFLRTLVILIFSKTQEKHGKD